MPRHKDRKRIIRGRMQKTGESYTTARAHVISKPQQKQPASARQDLAALAGMSDDKISAKTGRTWQEWMRVLDADGAATRPHRDIATLVHEKHRVGDWWAQMVTVGYERMKGLRDRGQRRGGKYEATKSKTLNVPLSVLFDAWANESTRRRWMDETEAVVRSATRHKSMRLQLSDGTAVVVWFSAKGPGKSVVALAHSKLPDRAAADESKKYWTARLNALESLLAANQV